MKMTINGKTTEYKDINDPLFAEILKEIISNTMWTMFHSIEPMYSLYMDVKYIVEHKIPGDIVECGVWKGGMIQLIALTLKKLGDESRKIYLYDTFEGLPEPSDCDKDWDGVPAHATWNKARQAGEKWGYGGTMEEVREIVFSTGYPEDKFVFSKGMVEETIPGLMPDQISILRLDTDFYSSTRHELIHLYPGLAVGGVLVIDDYGYFQGARKATDEYFAENKVKMLLNRINMSVHQGVKIEPLLQ